MLWFLIDCFSVRMCHKYYKLYSSFCQMLTMDNLIKSMLDENNKSLKKDIVKKCEAVVSEFITFLSEY